MTGTPAARAVATRPPMFAITPSLTAAAASTAFWTWMTSSAVFGWPSRVVMTLLSRDRDARLGRVNGEGERLGEVQLHRVRVVGQVADRQVLAEPELEV